MQQSANINVDFLQTYLHIPYDTHMIDTDFLGPVVPSPHRRTRQIIRYRATATLRRPQNKQYSASK